MERNEIGLGQASCMDHATGITGRSDVAVIIADTGVLKDLVELQKAKLYQKIDSIRVFEC